MAQQGYPHGKFRYKVEIDGIDAGGKPTASLNHYSYGAVAGWCISGICGINAGAEGIVIRPFPDKELKFANAALDSRFGRIESRWKYPLLQGLCPMHLQLLQMQS